MGQIKIQRVWAMPNSRTFLIPPIKELLDRYVNESLYGLDPFSNANSIASVTNDLDEDYDTNYHLEAKEFMKLFTDNSVDYVLWDPPYSPRQVSECYKRLGRTVNMQTTQSSFWGDMKKEIARVIRPGGFCVSLGWNSNGVGLKYGFYQREILLVAHGGSHNDTIVTVEYKKE